MDAELYRREGMKDNDRRDSERNSISKRGRKFIAPQKKREKERKKGKKFLKLKKKQKDKTQVKIRWKRTKHTTKNKKRREK